MSADLHLPVRFQEKALPWLLAVGFTALVGVDPTALSADGGSLDTAGPEVIQTESEDATEQQPLATQRESVIVEAPLPLIPSSNTITTKLPVDQVWTPFNVGAVSQPLMQEQFSLVLGDALENISGVNAQTGSGVFDFFVVRGFDSLTSGLILTDGAPEPETT
ncbi:MAG: TonB-dependent receptor plug domain-containing protein [Acidobacteriota bacterium]